MKRIFLKQFNPPYPANLPFYLLQWTQLYLRVRICLQDKALTTSCLESIQRSSFLEYSYHSSDTFSNDIASSPLFSEDHLASPITHVFYSEADQLVHFASRSVLHIVMGVGSGPTLLLPRRKEKRERSRSRRYDTDLVNVRSLCGGGGYFVEQDDEESNPKGGRSYRVRFPAASSFNEVSRTNRLAVLSGYAPLN